MIVIGTSVCYLMKAIAFHQCYLATVITASMIGFYFMIFLIVVFTTQREWHQVQVGPRRLCS